MARCTLSKEPLRGAGCTLCASVLCSARCRARRVSFSSSSTAYAHVYPRLRFGLQGHSGEEDGSAFQLMASPLAKNSLVLAYCFVINSTKQEGKVSVCPTGKN